MREKDRYVLVFNGGEFNGEDRYNKKRKALKIEIEGHEHKGIVVILQGRGRIIVLKPIINSDLCHFCN